MPGVAELSRESGNPITASGVSEGELELLKAMCAPKSNMDMHRNKDQQPRAVRNNSSTLQVQIHGGLEQDKEEYMSGTVPSRALHAIGYKESIAYIIV